MQVWLLGNVCSCTYYKMHAVGLDGQKIAIRLARWITVVTKSLKKCLNAYNIGIDESCHLSWEEAVNLSNQIYTDCLYSDSTIPNLVKCQAVQFYQEKCRAEEEIVRIKEEMLNCVHHYIGIHECLSNQIEFHKQLEDEMQLYNLGKICLLRKASIKCSNKLKSLQCFMKHTDIIELQRFLSTLSNVNQEQGLSQYILCTSFKFLCLLFLCNYIWSSTYV